MIDGSAKEGSPVSYGEQEKRDFYAATCDFPDTVKLVPFAIDTQGRWGEEFATFLKGYCKAAAGANHSFYNLLITRARDVIQVAHAIAVGTIVRNSMNSCISSADRLALAGRSRCAREV
jgi:hypothetical protein